MKPSIAVRRRFNAVRLALVMLTISMSACLSVAPSTPHLASSSESPVAPWDPPPPIEAHSKVANASGEDISHDHHPSTAPESAPESLPESAPSTQAESSAVPAPGPDETPEASELEKKKKKKKTKKKAARKKAPESSPESSGSDHSDHSHHHHDGGGHP